MAAQGWQQPGVSFSLHEALHSGFVRTRPLVDGERRQRYREYLDSAAQLAGSVALT